jgi:hypothetical protein
MPNHHTEHDSMGLSPLEANNLSATQEIPSFNRNRGFITVFTRTCFWALHGQINPVHNTPSYLLNIHFNIILSYTSKSCKWSLPFNFSDQTLVLIPS